MIKLRENKLDQIKIKISNPKKKIKPVWKIWMRPKVMWHKGENKKKFSKK